MANPSIPVSEVWERTTWNTWTTLQATSNGTTIGEAVGSETYSLPTQNHIDIVSFDARENWVVVNATSYSSGFQSTLNYWPGLIINFNAALYSFVSAEWEPLVTPSYFGPNTKASGNRMVDLTSIGSSSKLVLALPSCPASQINLSTSYFEFRDINNIALQVPWSANTTALISGNSTLTIPYAAILSANTNSADLTQINQLTINVGLTGSSTGVVTMMGLRLVNTAWTWPSFDFNSQNQYGFLPPSINGDLTIADAKTMPVLWRSTTPAGVNDPRPIDAKIGAMIVTNSNSATANSLSLYLRGNAAASVSTQTYLDTQTQADLASQPSQPQSTLDWIKFTLNWGTGGDSAVISYSYNGTPVTAYTFEGANALQNLLNSTWGLASNNTYSMVAWIEGTKARFQVYEANFSTNYGESVLNLIFDSNWIDDPAFLRQPGRIGFQATLNEGDTLIAEIRPYHLVFAEFQSQPLNSFTPVRSSRVFADFSPDVDLFPILTYGTLGWGPNQLYNGGEGGSSIPTIAIDQNRFYRGHQDNSSVRVNAVPFSGWIPGVVSGPLSPYNDPVTGISEWNELLIEFDIWAYSAAIASAGNSPAFLPVLIYNYPMAIGSNAWMTAPCAMPQVLGNQWQTIKVSMPLNTPDVTAYPSGYYQLGIFYYGTLDTAFWIDNVHVDQRSVKWSGRSTGYSPWEDTSPWIDYREYINSDTSGVGYTEMGTQLQTRAQAMRQDSQIYGNFTVIPKYAELGNFAWQDSLNAATQTALSSSSIPMAAFTIVTSTEEATPTNASTYHNPIISYIWDWGDDTSTSGIDPGTHFYNNAGTYTVTLQIVDSMGLTSSQSQVITV